ncbi:MAG: ATP-binding cassette domain-containing protein [Pseudonocardia sp.]
MAETASPEATSPEAASPEATSPEAASPETTSPETTSPETTSPETPASAAGTTSSTGPSGDPLIGVDDLETPYWTEGYATASKARLRDVARSAPRTIAMVARWAWRTSPPLTVLAGAVHLLAGCVTAFGLLATANVLTQLLEQGPTPERVVAALPALALVVAAYALGGLLDAATGAVEAALAPRVELRAQDALHAAVIEVDLAAFDDADYALLVQKAAGQGLNRIHQATRDVGSLLSGLVSMVAAVVTAGVFHPLLAPAVLLAAVPQGWASIRNAKLNYDSFVKMMSRTRRLDITGDLITERAPAAEVRAFTTQDVLLGEHRRIGDEVTTEAMRVEHQQNRNVLLGRALSGLGTGAAYVLLGLLLYAGGLPLALAAAAVVAMRTAASALRTTVYTANRLYEGGFYIDLYRGCLTDSASRRRPPAVAELRGDPEVIELRGVGFRYPGQDERALDGIDLTLRRGEVVALVGENGSGKSTLAKLVSGLYLPETGRVTWDGVDTGAVDQRALHDRVAVVMQDPTRWPMTAANNVRVGRLEHADPRGDRLDGAAAVSGADAVVAELPDGWSTVLSREFQGGRDLSGGQWQRISVARGLFREAPVVVADEPTAALDARAEAAVFAALRAMARGSGGDRIAVLVTHRLANIRHADQIVVLEKGRIVERGTHDELMARRGVYAELFGIQARAYAGVPAVDQCPPDTVRA